MNKMVIFTTLFFNKVGNQSMLETVKQYSKHFDVYIVTSASENDNYYLSSESAKEVLPANVYFFRQSSWFKDIFRSIFSYFVSLKGKKESSTAPKVNDSLVNLHYSFLNIVSFKVSYISLFVYASFLRVFREIPHAKFICAYEIGGVVPAMRYQKIMDKKAKIFGKMQGTILYDAISNGVEKVDVNYSLDHQAYSILKKFNLVCMTNDGTNGDKVLEYYGVGKSSYLHIMNGISEGIVEYKKQYTYQMEKRQKIKIVTVSRLVGWKRVHLGVEIINYLVNKYQCTNIVFDIYGYGSPSEISLLVSLVDKYGLNEFVSIKGQVSHDAVAKIMVDADFIISLYKMTNVTNPLLEALFLNVPVLTLSDDSLLSIVNHDENKNRYIFDEVNENSLVEEISGFLNSMDIEKIRRRRCSFNNVTESELMTWEKRINTEVSKLNSIA
jgi:glycosyltransferase involved in cell wall biosynthesis